MTARFALLGMSDEVSAALIGAVVGALVGAAGTAVATWAVAVRLDRLQEARRVLAALSVIQVELASDLAPICRFERDEVTVEELQDGLVTHGDWDSNKGVAAALQHEDPGLWGDLVAVYDELHLTVRRADNPPSSERVQDVERRLGELRPSARLRGLLQTTQPDGADRRGTTPGSPDA